MVPWVRYFNKCFGGVVSLDIIFLGKQMSSSQWRDWMPCLWVDGRKDKVDKRGGRGSLKGKTRQTWRAEETGLTGERRQGVEEFPPRWCVGNRLSQAAGSISLTTRQSWLPVEQIKCSWQQSVCWRRAVSSLQNMGGAMGGLWLTLAVTAQYLTYEKYISLLFYLFLSPVLS